MLQAQIFIDKDELRGSRPLYEFIMKLLIDQGIAGATAFPGHAGFGRNLRLKQPAQQFSFDETPMLISFIDNEEKVVAALKQLRSQYQGGFITTHKVEQW